MPWWWLSLGPLTVKKNPRKAPASGCGVLRSGRSGSVAWRELQIDSLRERRARCSPAGAGHALRRPPGRPLSFLWLLHDCGGAAIFAQVQRGSTVTWRLITFQLRAGTPRQRARPCGRAEVCPPHLCPRPARPGTRAHPALAVWPLVYLQWSDLDFPLVCDYDLWLSVCGRATVRMVVCKIWCNTPAETIKVHATVQQRVPCVMC